eukprot:6002799-Amphidinium_carterae.1
MKDSKTKGIKSQYVRTVFDCEVTDADAVGQTLSKPVSLPGEQVVGGHLEAVEKVVVKTERSICVIYGWLSESLFSLGEAGKFDEEIRMLVTGEIKPTGSLLGPVKSLSSGSPRRSR